MTDEGDRGRCEAQWPPLAMGWVDMRGSCFLPISAGARYSNKPLFHMARVDRELSCVQ